MEKKIKLYLHESCHPQFSKLIKQLLKIRGGMRELSGLAVAGCWWPCFPVLVIVSDSWTMSTSQFEHSSILIREINPAKHLHWFLLIPSASFIQLGSHLTGHLPYQLLAVFLELEEEGMWEHTKARSDTPNWCTLPPLLTGVSPGLRTVEKAIIWFHVWVYSICTFLQLYYYHDDGLWLSHLWALIQDCICCLGHRLPVMLKSRTSLKTTTSSDLWREMEIHTVTVWIIFLCWNNITQQTWNLVYLILSDNPWSPFSQKSSERVQLISESLLLRQQNHSNTIKKTVLAICWNRSETS